MSFFLGTQIQGYQIKWNIKYKHSLLPKHAI